MSLSHLAPYVRISKEKIKRKLKEDMNSVNVAKEKINKVLNGVEQIEQTENTNQEENTEQAS